MLQKNSVLKTDYFDKQFWQKEEGKERNSPGQRGQA